MAARAPDVSIVIPVYSEEGILRDAVTELVANLEILKTELHDPGLRFEIILAENGSAIARPSWRHTSPRDPDGADVLARRAELRQGAAPRHPGGAGRSGDLRGDRSVRSDFHRRALEVLRHARMPTWWSAARR
jgi:hypothetical protein